MEQITQISSLNFKECYKHFRKSNLIKLFSNTKPTSSGIKRVATKLNKNKTSLVFLIALGVQMIGMKKL